MSRVNQAQMKKLLDLLSEDGVLVNGKVSYSTVNKQNFWKRIALHLNSVEGGVYKNTWKWCKMWADWKNKTKKKANILLRKKHYSYGQQVAPLTSLELRLLKMINYPLDDKANNDVLDMEMVSKVELPEPTADEITDFLAESFDPPLHPEHENMSSDEEDNTALGYFAKNKRKFCNVGDVLPDGESKFDIGGDSSDAEKKVKMKGKKFKKKKTSLEEFKIRTTLALEKERVQQKSEELRLRALELKLKGEEMRLKEIEMNKINYLTNIEEEKLKCFKDISASLKDWMEEWKDAKEPTDLFELNSHRHPQGFKKARRVWCSLNRLRTGVGHCDYLRKRWGWSNIEGCDRGCPKQTVKHIIFECPLTKYDGPSSHFKDLTGDAVDYLKKCKFKL